ncbi:MAG: PulJ/GspJ family protein, partial [Tepidisphaeraceae bacterium]
MFRGFSLAEMAIAMAILGIMAVAIQSTVVLSSRVIADTRNGNVAFISATEAYQQLASELSCAITVTELTP